MSPEGRPERRPAALPRIQKAPTTGHPARHVESVPEPPVETPTSGAVPSELKAKTPQTVPLSVRVPPTLMRRLRFCVFENETKMQSLVEFALDEWLREHGY